MIHSKKIMSLIGLTVISLAGLRCDKVIPIDRKGFGKPNDERPVLQNKNINTIRNFFEYETITLSDDLTDEFYNKYDDDIVNAMKAVLSAKGSFLQSYALNKAVNTMIYKKLTELVRKSDGPIEQGDEVILQALDMIVPDASSDESYAISKQDLRKFCSESPQHCKQITQRARKLFETGYMHTINAIQTLESAFHNWIPLARTEAYILKNGLQQ